MTFWHPKALKKSELVFFLQPLHGPCLHILCNNRYRHVFDFPETGTSCRTMYGTILALRIRQWRKCISWAPLERPTELWMQDEGAFSSIRTSCCQRLINIPSLKGRHYPCSVTSYLNYMIFGCRNCWFFYPQDDEMLFGCLLHKEEIKNY